MKLLSYLRVEALSQQGIVRAAVILLGYEKWLRMVAAKATQKLDYMHSASTTQNLYHC